MAAVSTNHRSAHLLLALTTSPVAVRAPSSVVCGTHPLGSSHPQLLLSADLRASMIGRKNYLLIVKLMQIDAIICLTNSNSVIGSSLVKLR